MKMIVTTCFLFWIYYVILALFKNDNLFQSVYYEER